MLKPLLATFFIPILLTSNANAQLTNLEISENQGVLLAQLGIVRMITTSSTTNSSRAPFITRTQESYFDNLGRITRTKSDLCSECGTVYEYDSLSGLVSYTREISVDDVTENFKEYDAHDRPSAIETCSSKEPSCITYWFEYDSAQVQRVYKTERTTRLGYNKANRTRLKHTWQTKRELIQESVFSPEGQLEESRFYEKGEFSHSLFYEYDSQVRLIQTWSVYNGIKKLFATIEYNEKGQISLTKTAHLRGSPSMLNFELYTNRYEYADNGLLVKSGTSTNIREYSYLTK